MKADVGGGNVRNEEPHCLAKIPLRWMVNISLNLNMTTESKL